MKTKTKRLILTAFYTILIGELILFPLSKYVLAKTIGKGTTDCMIEYINNSYPKGSTYLIYGKLPHIDKVGIENQYMIKTGDVYGCNTGDINNTIYCNWTLLLETL